MVDTPNTKNSSNNLNTDNGSNELRRDSIRKRLIKERRTLEQPHLISAAAALASRCIPLLENAKTVAGYKAINGEISVDRVFTNCHQSGIKTLLPIMRGERLMFAEFDSDSTLVPRVWGILEPNVPESGWVSPMDIDVVLMPLVAFDAQCNRMGMGGGFYDRSFAARRESAAPPLLVGVAHGMQQVDSVLAEWWDVPLDFVVTDEGVIGKG